MVTLVIMDGFGIRKQKWGNAIACQGTPHIDQLMKKYPHTKIFASGEAVGLPAGQMGNSEVGHLTIGAGKVVYQSLMRINKDIESGALFEREQMVKVFRDAEKSGRLHLIGLLSDGGVHSHIDHLVNILEESKKYNIGQIFIHAILDGRDVPPDSAKIYLDFVKQNLESNMSIASLSGRIYTMDREKRYDRLQKSYDMLTKGEAVQKDYVECLEDSYEKGVFDEFVEPTLLNQDGVIKDGDSVLFYNFRWDRAIELTEAFTDEHFNKFETIKFKQLNFSIMEEYSEKFKNLNVIYPPEVVENNLAKIISENGLKQYHISETTKYAHVTFFINGLIEKPYENEDRKLIDTVDAQNFEYYPKMRACEISQELMEQIASQKYDFLLVNLCNLDMVGHTGNFNATKEAVQCVDKCVYAIALASLMAGGECVIIADHGNADVMYDKDGNKITSHTTSPVPFILVSNKKYKIYKKGGLANVAPTVLQLLNLPIPKDMERSMIKNRKTL